MDGRNKKFILELQKKPKVRRESGLYTVDGPKMAGELDPGDVENVYVTKSFLASQHFKECEELLRSVRYELVQDSEMKQMSDTVTPQGILVVARQKRVRGIRAMAEGVKDPLFLILETIQDPGNLGTIFRTAEAAGVTGIIMNNETVDAWSPKVVRSTMGAVLRMPFTAVDDLNEAVTKLASGAFTEGNKVNIYAAHLDGAVDYAAADLKGASAIMIGNESRGLSDELSGRADKKILIPMCGRTESLNAAVAAAVICFEAARQRRIN
ncbi:MAG: RNA methyltransferase [Eubacteriales bacterium]|nr:RNA methyltransferase [Eubacteriales bacterium]